MQRILETRMQWPLEQPLGTDLKGFQVLKAHGDIRTVEPVLWLFMEFQGDESLPGPFYEHLNRILAKTALRVYFGGSAINAKRHTVWFKFPRVKHEDVCVTVFKAFVLILTRLGVERLNEVARWIAPKITQQTYWRVGPGDARAEWIGHGEFLARRLAPAQT